VVPFTLCCSDIPPDIDDVVIAVNNKEKMSKDKEVCEYSITTNQHTHAQLHCVHKKTREFLA